MVFLLGAISSYAYEQGDTITVVSDRTFPTMIEAEWLDPDASHKIDEANGFVAVDPLVLPVTETSEGITYVKSGPSSMLLSYNINVTGAGATYKLMYRFKKTAALGNIRHFVDGNYLGGTKGAAQTPLPGAVDDGWQEFTDSKIITFTPGFHTYGILMNRSNSHLVDYFYLVPITLTEEGAKATVTTPTTNPGMVKKSPDYDTSFVVGDVVEFTAVPEENYYFKQWEGDVSGTMNPLTHTLDTTNKVKAVFYRTPDTVLLANDRYAPVDFEAEATCKWWHRDHAVDSLTEIGIITNTNIRAMREGKEVITKIQHGGKMFFPITVGGNGGTYRLSYTYFKNADGGNLPGNFIYLDDVRINNEAVLTISGAVGDYKTSSQSAAFELTPGNHVIALKPNGGSGKFDLDKITLTPDSIAAVDAQVNVSATLGGSVAKMPDYDTHYVVGDSLTLEATPDFGFLFGSWSGDVESTDNPLKLKLDSGMTIVANFVDDPDISNYTVTVTPKDSGMVTISPDLEDYATGSDITIEATPKFGYFFKEWTGDITGSENPVMIDSIAMDYVVDAVFEALPTYKLTIVDAHNTVVRDLDLEDYPEGTTVMLTAGQNRTHRFAYWNDDMMATDKELSITIMSDTTVTVNYETKDEVMPGDYFYIDADEYITDTIQAELYDRETSDWIWDGPESGQELVIDTIAGTDTVIVTRTGNGKGMEYTLMVGNEGGEFILDYFFNRNVTGTNNVKVFIDGKQISSDYAEIGIPEATVGTWAKATSKHNVKLTPGKHILRLQFHYSDRHNVDYFTFYPVAGSIAVDGGLMLSYDESRGTVSQDPYKLVYDKGEDVTLVAEPLEGFMFKEWKGDFMSTEDSVVIKMDSTIRVEAVFVPGYTVGIDSATVNGTVTISPMKDLYEGGDTVTFVPVPDQGYKFDGWFAEGGISGDTIPLEIVISRNFELTAYFSQVVYRLAATAGDNGSIAKSPNRISYTAGTEVTITATADAGYEFDAWTGDVTSSVNPLVITMDSMITVQATFKQEASALNDVQAVELSIYPNPSEAIFTVSVKEKVSYAVYDLSGSMIKNGVSNGAFELDMASFNKGIYTLQVMTEKGSSVQRLMLK